MDSRLIYGPVESFSIYCSLASILFKVREFDENVYQNRKNFKAQYEFPPYDFVQFQAARHRPRLTDTIWPLVIHVPWFYKGFNKQLVFSIKEEKAHARRHNQRLTRMRTRRSSQDPQLLLTFYVFKFILSMSSGFDLSSLFENKSKVGTWGTYSRLDLPSQRLLGGLRWWQRG